MKKMLGRAGKYALQHAQIKKRPVLCEKAEQVCRKGAGDDERERGP